MGDGSDHIYLSQVSGHAVPVAGPPHSTCLDVSTVTRTAYVCGPDCPTPEQEALNRARDARRRVYAEDTRRAAARALDRYLQVAMCEAGAMAPAPANEFVELVGDYVLSRLQHNRHYGVVCSELPACRDGGHSASCEVAISLAESVRRNPKCASPVHRSPDSCMGIARVPGAPCGRPDAPRKWKCVSCLSGVETYACPDCGDDVSAGDDHQCDQRLLPPRVEGPS
jgi:hypothetical protein